MSLVPGVNEELVEELVILGLMVDQEELEKMAHQVDLGSPGPLEPQAIRVEQESLEQLDLSVTLDNVVSKV